MALSRFLHQYWQRLTPWLKPPATPAKGGPTPAPTPPSLPFDRVGEPGAVQVVPPRPGPIPRRPGPEAPILGLALQGGGPLGAYTWGVLDRLLEQPALPPLALSGTSAGAINACVLASHLHRGGPEAARLALARLWRRVSEAAKFTLAGGRPSWMVMPETGAAASAALLGLATRLFAPYQLNPLDLNPLRDILKEEIDFDAIRDPHCPRLLISATRLRDGAAHLFTNETLSLEAILASATVPHLHKAMEIDGEAYWDGGYVANPPVRALLDLPGLSRALVVQLIVPDFGEGTPKTNQEIATRLNQIAFSRPLATELELLGERHGRQDVDFLSLDPQLAARAWQGLGCLDWRYLLRLHAHGRRAAEQWLSRSA